MKKIVNVLVVSAKGELLMKRRADGKVTAFGGVVTSGEVPARAAVRVLSEETGLDVRADDLEFLDSYRSTLAVHGEDADADVFVLAGVDEDRVYVYDGEESLCKIHRNDDFEANGLSVLARKYVIDYFKRHKR
ncbi:MAG: hypothetical protein JWN01_902 [Patescibacteria group bacterium]|nr:hypothetical protein [Patescibacteria group bacterium]